MELTDLEILADRIIRVKDGKVVYDAPWEEQQIYQYNDDTNLYLKEFGEKSYYNDNVQINLYDNGSSGSVISLSCRLLG